MLSGKLYENFIQPPFTFNYIGFDFLQPLPGNGMYIYFGLMALLGLMIMFGFFYRIAMPGFALLWTIVYLMQKSNYNNHYYLMLILCWMMCLAPAHVAYSLDSRIKPSIKKETCPQWVPWLFISQAAIMYFYAAINKINADWLSGKFIAVQFSRLSHHHILGPLYSSKFFQLFICYSGFLFDLFIVPLLLWKRTRNYAFAAFCLFHLFNSYTFRIGIFPYLSIAMAVFFFDPQWIREKILRVKDPVIEPVHYQTEFSIGKKILVGILTVHIFLQLLLPLRSLFYPGNVFWTEEGYRMSWKMMLRAKWGHIHFKVKDDARGQQWLVDPAEKFSKLHVSWIAICPDIAWQYAQRLKSEYNASGHPGVKIYAVDSVYLNKNPPQLLIDTTVDLAAEKWKPFSHADWILPFRKN